MQSPEQQLQEQGDILEIGDIEEDVGSLKALFLLLVFLSECLGLWMDGRETILRGEKTAFLWSDISFPAHFPHLRDTDIGSPSSRGDWLRLQFATQMKRGCPHHMSMHINRHDTKELMN